MVFFAVFAVDFGACEVHDQQVQRRRAGDDNVVGLAQRAASLRLIDRPLRSRGQQRQHKG